MKAYRINLIGTNDHYLVTEKQKPHIQEMMNKPGSLISIGGNTFRASAIKSITQTSVDLNSCPDYFYNTVQSERAGTKDDSPFYRKLPTEWVILSDDGEFITTDVSRQSEDVVARTLAKKDPSKRYLLAKCHYEIGSDGERQYYTKLDQIPEALKKRPDPDWPFGSPIVQIYRYGERQIDPVTGKIKGLNK